MFVELMKENTFHKPNDKGRMSGRSDSVGLV